MKGVVFNIFESFLNEVGGEDFFDDLLDEVELETKEPFVGPGTYPDADLMTLFIAAVGKLNIPPEDALRSFGKFLFGQLYATHPQYAEGHNLRSFLLSIHDVIHVEVRKLYPEAVTPDFVYEELTDNKLKMTYQSPRRLWHLASGLIEACSEQFNEAIELEMECSSTDQDTCDFIITFK